jgi:methylmalonyl-CoA/ethylmalonyl-CoA epimerase
MTASGIYYPSACSLNAVCHDTGNAHARRADGRPVMPDREPGTKPALARIDHVGIACRDLTEKITFYREVFGLTVASLETNEEQGVREAMLRFPLAPPGAPSYVQLLEPLGPDTPVGKFIARRGEGLHHVGYAVADITAALASVGGAGVRLIDERPRHGSMGAAIAFLHPADIGGVLTELVQSPKATDPPPPGQASRPGA